MSKEDSLQPVVQLSADRDFISFLEMNVAMQRFIIDGHFYEREDVIREVVMSYDKSIENPDYINHAKVKSDRLMIQYFSILEEQKRLQYIIAEKWPYFYKMSGEAKVNICREIKEEKGINISPEEAIEILRSRPKY